MKERIQKIISQRGVASRRVAEQMIIAGRVTCNGNSCTLGQTADPDLDQIAVDGHILPPEPHRVYIMLNKPKGYVTTLSDEKGRKNAAMLVQDCGARVYPVGRLDMDSEGLLLFTNDGALAEHIMHPRHTVNKTYYVEVSGYTPENLSLLKRSVFLDGYRIAPPDVKLLSNHGNFATVEVTIHEGRNRQVRRMCAKAHMQVKRLIRVQEGKLKLGELSSGKWRYLTETEVKELKDE